MANESVWIGSKLGFPLPANPNPSRMFPEDRDPARPWWVFQGFSQWRRQDDLVTEVFKIVDGGSWSIHRYRDEEVLGVIQSNKAPLAQIDRQFPMARPRVRAGQVWAFPDGDREPALFLVTGSGHEGFEWLDGELVRHADVERVDFLLAGWCLVSGPGAPWAPPSPEEEVP